MSDNYQITPYKDSVRSAGRSTMGALTRANMVGGYTTSESFIEPTSDTAFNDFVASLNGRQYIIVVLSQSTPREFVTSSYTTARGLGTVDPVVLVDPHTLPATAAFFRLTPVCRASRDTLVRSLDGRSCTGERLARFMVSPSMWRRGAFYGAN